MSISENKFKETFGFSLPEKIGKFYFEVKRYPVGFKFRNVEFILEIQYLLDVNDSANYDVENKLLAFAITSDGYKLLVDLSSEKFEILQKESSDVDDLGITMDDLLESEKYLL